MKFTLSWLKDHLETTASLAQIAETLTNIGLEVEGIEDKACSTGTVHRRLHRESRATPESR